jgi:prolyl oligopeptidase
VQVALMGQSFSKDGSVMAYSLSSGGSDWREVLFMGIDDFTGAQEDLPDKLTGVKFSSMAWTHDSKCDSPCSGSPPRSALYQTEC